MQNRIVPCLKPLLLSASFLLLLALPALPAEPLTLQSPSDNLTVTFAVKSNPQPYLPGPRAYYSIAFNGRTILADSPLGIEFKGAPALDHDLEITGSRRETKDQAWDWKFGGESRIRDHFNQLTVSLRERHAPHRRFEVALRAYDTGVAFRYFLPQQSALAKFTISNEETGFYFAEPGSAYALDVGHFDNNYEAEFQHLKLGDIRTQSVVGLPLTVRLEGGSWVGILEADLTNYAGLYVQGAPAVPNGLRGRLCPLGGRYDQAVIAQTPLFTPWRILLISPTAGGLIEASEPMILNLSPPTKIADTSWVEPGKTAWDWWSGDYAEGVSFEPGMNTATLLHYVDFAAQAHLPYMLVDAGWSPDYGGQCAKIKPGGSSIPENGWCTENDILHWVPQVNLPVIIQHAKERNVKILLWIHWTAAVKQMEKAFPLYEKWGVAGVKVDFMGNVPDNQTTVNLYRKIVSTAARYHLTVDIHGAYKPAGVRREYPNLLTREGVLGLEYNKWSSLDTPYHNTVLPFTRLLAGPMDFTPGCFNNATQAAFQPRDLQPMCQGTRANQLAMYVVYLSPLQMLSDYPENYLGKPGFQFLEKVPTVWEETKVLNGEPGEYITVARRHSDQWYLGSMSNWTPRKLKIPLSFLGSGNWKAEIFADGPNASQDATSLAISTRGVTSAETLPAQLAPGGGLAVIFSPAR